MAGAGGEDRVRGDQFLVAPHESRVRAETGARSRVCFDEPRVVRREPSTVRELVQAVESLQNVLGVQRFQKADLVSLFKRSEAIKPHGRNRRDHNHARKKVRQLASAHHDLSVRHFEKQLFNCSAFNAAALLGHAKHTSKDTSDAFVMKAMDREGSFLLHPPRLSLVWHGDVATDAPTDEGLGESSVPLQAPSSSEEHGFRATVARSLTVPTDGRGI